MAEQVVTDLILNLGPFEQQIDKAVEGMERYDGATVDATKDTKTFENALGTATGKLNATKVATEGASKAAEVLTKETTNAAKSGGQVGLLSGAWDTVKNGVSAAKEGVLDFFRGARDGVKTAIGEVGGFRGIFNQVSDNAKSALGITRVEAQSTGKSLNTLKSEIDALNKKKLTLTDPRQIAATNAQITKLTGEYNNLNRTGVKAGTQISGGLKGITGQLQSAIPQVGGLGGSILGLLGPVGIAAGAISGIGLAFAKNTDAGATFLDGISRTGGIVFDKLTGTVSRFFGSFTDGTGTVSKVFGAIADGATFALTKLNPIFILLEKIGVVDAFKEAAADGQLLAQAYDDIDDAQIKNIKSNAVLDKQIRELEVKLRNRTTSEQERLKIGEQIGKLEEQRAADELKVLQQITAAKRKEAELELRDNDEVSDETRRALAEAEAAELAAAGASVERVERTQNRIDQIRKQGDDKRAAASAKVAAEEKKIADQRLAVEQELNRASLELLDERTKAEQQALNTRDERVQKAAGDAALLIQIEQAYQDEVQAIRDKGAADAEAIANKQAQALQNAQLVSAQSRLERLTQLQELDLEIAKAGGNDVTELQKQQAEERLAIETEIADIRLAQLEAQYQADFEALDGNLIAQLDRLAEFELAKAELVGGGIEKELEQRKELLAFREQEAAAVEGLEAAKAQAAEAGVALASQLLSKSEEGAKAAFLLQKGVAAAQVIIQTAAATSAALAQAIIALGPVAGPIAAAPAIAALKTTAGINLGIILAQSIAGFDKGGLVDSKGGRVKRADGVRIPTRPGGDNMLAYVQEGELYLNQRQRAKAEKLYPGLFGEIGVPGFSKPNHTYAAEYKDGYYMPDISTHQRYISTAGAVNSYVEGRTTNVTYNNSSTTAAKWSDKKMVGAIGQTTKETRKQTELLAMIAKGNRRPNKRYYA